MAGQIDHPILITECVGNPVYSRSKMAELLFDTYGVPAVGMTLVSSAFLIFLLKQMFDITLLLTQHLEWMLLSAISTTKDMENVEKMELLSVLVSLQHTPFLYVSVTTHPLVLQCFYIGIDLVHGFFTGKSLSTENLFIKDPAELTLVAIMSLII